MRIVTVVGIRASGKTTVIEALAGEWTRRGKRVGTVKTVSCPGFHMDKPGSNSWRHARAGAELVTVRAEGETTLLYPRALKPSEIYEAYRGFDWVLAEGDYALPAARIVAAHGEADALERVNPLTLAFSGRLADAGRELNGLGIFHYERDIVALCGLLEDRVAEVKDLSALDEGLCGEDLALSRAHCAARCGGHRAPGEGVTVNVDGRPLALSPEREEILRAWAAEK